MGLTELFSPFHYVCFQLRVWQYSNRILLLFWSQVMANVEMEISSEKYSSIQPALFRCTEKETAWKGESTATKGRKHKLSLLWQVDIAMGSICHTPTTSPLVLVSGQIYIGLAKSNRSPQTVLQQSPIPLPIPSRLTTNIK
jgi:hypothetical protein